jgi:hypothetical protein
MSLFIQNTFEINFEDCLLQGTYNNCDCQTTYRLINHSRNKECLLYNAGRGEWWWLVARKQRQEMLVFLENSTFLEIPVKISQILKCMEPEDND